MNRTKISVVRLAVCLSLLMLALGGVIGGCQSPQNRLVGRWKYVGPGKDTELPKPAEGSKEATTTYKDITEKGWTLTEFTTVEKNIRKSQGGTYTLVGDTYTETVEFGPLHGNKFQFQCTLEGNKWIHKDLPSPTVQSKDQLGVDEIWERVF